MNGSEKNTKFDVIKHPKEAIKLGIKCARSNLGPYNKLQIASIQLLTQICLAFINHKKHKVALRLIKHICNHDMGPNKAQATIAVATAFIKNKQIYYAASIAATLLHLKGKYKIMTIREIGRIFKAHRHIDEMQKIAFSLMNRSESYAKKAGKQLIQESEDIDAIVLPTIDYDLNKDLNSVISLGIKLAKSNKDMLDPIQIRNIHTAQAITIDLIKQKRIKESLQITIALIGQSMAYLKSQAIISIADELITENKTKIAVKIAQNIAKLHGPPKVYCCQEMALSLIKKNHFNEAKVITRLLETHKSPYAQKIASELKNHMSSKPIQSAKKLDEAKPERLTALSMDLLRQEALTSAKPLPLSDQQSPSSNNTAQPSTLSQPDQPQVDPQDLKKNIELFKNKLLSFLKSNNIQNDDQYLIVTNKPQKKDVPSYFLTEFMLKNVVHVIKTDGVYETFEFELKKKILRVNEERVSESSNQYKKFFTHLLKSFDQFYKKKAHFYRDSSGTI